MRVASSLSVSAIQATPHEYVGELERAVSVLVDRITAVLREALSLDDFDGDQLYEGAIDPRELAERVAEALQPDLEAVVRALVDCDARIHRLDARYFRRMARAALLAAGWTAVEESP